MAHVERRGQGRWRARYRGPDGRERSKTFDRRVDAERWLAGVAVARARGEWVDPALGRTTLAEWTERWWPTTANLRPSTRARDETYLRCYVLPAFGAWRLADVGQLDVSTWVAELSASGRAPATVQKAYQLLGKVMGAAVDAGLLARSPCQWVPLPRVEREEMRFLDPAEVARLADAFDPRYRALVFVASYGGLRLGELAGLRRHRVDLLRGTVAVAEIAVEVRGTVHVGQPKTKAGRRTVGLPGPWPTSWAGTWRRRRRRGSPRRWCSRRRTAATCARRRGGGGSGSPPCGPPGWRRCGLTTCATLPSPCGSRPGPVRRRWLPGPGTPRSPSPSTATATSSRATTRTSGTDSTP